MKKTLILISALIASLLLCSKVHALTVENIDEWDHDWNEQDYSKSYITSSKDGGVTKLYEYYNDEKNNYFYKLLKYNINKEIVFQKDYIIQEELPTNINGFVENKDGKILVYGYDYVEIDNNNSYYGRFVEIGLNGNINLDVEIGKNSKNDYYINNGVETSDGKYMFIGYTIALITNIMIL